MPRYQNIAGNILLTHCFSQQPEMTCVGEDDLKGKDLVQVEVQTADCVRYSSFSLAMVFTHR